MSHPVLVLGATGFTGELTVRALLRDGIPVIAAGRRADRLEALAQRLGPGLETLVVDVADPASLARAFDRPLGAVAACAGPFTELGEPVIEAALAAGVPYLDCTGEQGFMRRCIERFDAPARAAGVAVVNAFAFEYALGDWVCDLLWERSGPLSAIEVFYRLDSPLVSRGTWLSMKAQAAAVGMAWEGGALVERALGSEIRRHTFPGDDAAVRLVLAPFGEVLTVPRRRPVAALRTYMSIPPRSGSLSHMAEAEKQPDGRPFGPGDEERTTATFAIAAVGQGEADARPSLTLFARDPYGVTADLLAWGASRLAGGLVPGGVLTPSELVPAAEGVAWVCERYGARLV